MSIFKRERSDLNIIFKPKQEEFSKQFTMICESLGLCVYNVSEGYPVAIFKPMDQVMFTCHTFPSITCPNAIRLWEGLRNGQPYYELEFSGMTYTSLETMSMMYRKLCNAYKSLRKKLRNKMIEEL